MEITIIGEVIKIGKEIDYTGQDSVDMMYNFNKANVDIVLENGSRKTIQFVGNRAKWMKDIKLHLECIFTVETKIAYGNTYYDCRNFGVLRNKRNNNIINFRGRDYIITTENINGQLNIIALNNANDDIIYIPIKFLPEKNDFLVEAGDEELFDLLQLHSIIYKVARFQYENSIEMNFYFRLLI